MTFVSASALFSDSGTLGEVFSNVVIGALGVLFTFGGFHGFWRDLCVRLEFFFLLYMC